MHIAHTGAYGGWHIDSENPLVLLAGPSGCGKTLMCRQGLMRNTKSMTRNSSSNLPLGDFGFDQEQTIEEQHLIVIPKQPIFRVMDTGGSPEMRVLVTQHMRIAQVVVLVFDASNPKTLCELLPYAEELYELRGDDKPGVLFVANKMDMVPDVMWAARMNAAQSLAYDRIKAMFSVTYLETCCSVPSASGSYMVENPFAAQSLARFSQAVIDRVQGSLESSRSTTTAGSASTNNLCLSCRSTPMTSPRSQSGVDLYESMPIVQRVVSNDSEVSTDVVPIADEGESTPTPGQRKRSNTKTRLAAAAAAAFNTVSRRKAADTPL